MDVLEVDFVETEFVLADAVIPISDFEKEFFLELSGFTLPHAKIYFFAGLLKHNSQGWQLDFCQHGWHFIVVEVLVDFLKLEDI